MKKLLLFLGLFVISGVQSATAQTWEDAYAVPNMLGDGGLLQPNLEQLSSVNPVLYNLQQHTTKICDNNSVIPRDRIGFHFDSLQTVQVGQDGIAQSPTRSRNLQEYRFWGEKTFLDDNLSLDLIVPVYYSTDPNIDTVAKINNATPLAGQFGDLAFGLKALVWEDADKAYSAGVRVEAPTGPDFLLTNTVTPIDSFEMDAWFFTPWIGGQWTPGTNWFASGFLSYRLNSGSQNNFFNQAGQNFPFRQPTYLYADFAVGRWIVQREGQGGLTSLAPVVELHYTTTPTIGEQRGTGGTYETGQLFGHTDYLNITGGLNGTFNDAWQFGIGGALPLRTGAISGPNTFSWNTDRTFSWALLANLNYYFR